jgi:hypothetical protein
MWKLQKFEYGESLVLALSGRIEGAQLAELEGIVKSDAERRRVVLDLGALKLVDQDVVSFLAHCENIGIRLDNCPAYIREWITRRKAVDGEEASEDTL